MQGMSGHDGDRIRMVPGGLGADVIKTKSRRDDHLDEIPPRPPQLFLGFTHECHDRLVSLHRRLVFRPIELLRITPIPKYIGRRLGQFFEQARAALRDGHVRGRWTRGVPGSPGDAVDNACLIAPIDDGDGMLADGKRGGQARDGLLGAAEGANRRRSAIEGNRVVDHRDPHGWFIRGAPRQEKRETLEYFGVLPFLPNPAKGLYGVTV